MGHPLKEMIITERRTGQGYVGDLLVVPPAAYVAVIAREPDLLQVGGAARDALPQRRAEGVARLVESQRLERVFHLIGDLGVGEGPCAVC
jgi:hypothetical protein